MGKSTRWALKTRLFCAGGKRDASLLRSARELPRTGWFGAWTTANDSSAPHVRYVVFEAPSTATAGMSNVATNAAAARAATLCSAALGAGLAVIHRDLVELNRNSPRLIAMERLEH